MPDLSDLENGSKLYGALKAVPKPIQEAVTALLKPYQVSWRDIISAMTKNNTEIGVTKKFLTVKEAMNYTGLSRSTLNRASKSGMVECSKLTDAKSGKLLYRRSSLDEWLERKRVRPEDDEMIQESNR